MTELEAKKSTTQLHKEWVKNASWKEILEENFEGVDRLTAEDVKKDFSNLRRKILL